MQSKGALRKGKVPLFTLTMLPSTLVQPQSAAGYANPNEGWISCFQSFAGWEVSKMSLSSRIGPRSDLYFRRKYCFTTNEKRKEFGIHKLDTGETSKQED